MASTSTVPTESVVTIKVNYEGQTKRCKLPLRDMGATTLEDKLRASLEIPSSRPCKFERYSDSAGTYVVLDRSNVSVYKQLYRAAKAKSKLKIRVTDMTPLVEEEEEKQVPQPVTIEDEAEQPAQPETAEPAMTASKAEEKAPEPVPEAKPESNEPELQRTAAFRPRCFNSTEALDFEQCLANLVKQQEGLSLDLNNRLSNLASYRPTRYQPPAPIEAPAEPLSAAPARPWGDFRVCCNHCEKTIPDDHYHCSKCDDDDFDLCLTCVDSGVTCYGADHWLIKRFKKNGIFVSSTTETIPPKPKAKDVVRPASPALFSAPLRPVAPEHMFPLFTMRTCNCCVQEFPETQFLHCTTCEDYDLCTGCFERNAHGHHPKHGFVPAVEGTAIPCSISAKLNPGRNQIHSAICDGCDKYVRGVRHKCLDCPDWDYCKDCIVNAKIVHPGHRFVPIYEPLTDIRARGQCTRPVHAGICCDGPLCTSRSRQSYITGIRYKCAVCHDTDFCANCEASPANTHNKTHPLIKFKTAVRHVTVSTSGERSNGMPMPTMGDRHARPPTSSRATETTVSRQVSMNSVQTVVDVEPTEPQPQPRAPELLVDEEKAFEKEEEVEVAEDVKEEAEAELEVKPEVESETEQGPVVGDLDANYIRDTVTDGTVLPPNHVFEQTWVLRNTGKVAWPAGCAVKFVGGDYMGHVDSNHPAGISELVSASESTVCYEPLEAGKEFPFTVLLRTPAREGKIISYWRLTTQDGIKFGHRLWCDVSVQAPKAKEEAATVAVSMEKETVVAAPTLASSQMVFPKLEKESPVSSIHQDAKPAKPQASMSQVQQEDDVDDFDDCQEWDGSDEGFLTDEEYDILDASDEEYLEEQQKKLLKK